MIATAAPRPQAASLMIAATSLGFVLVQLDVSILNVALARIGTEIGAGMSGLQWVVDSYTLALASLQLGAGALGDRVGARKAYVCGFAIFLLGSLGCGIAPNVAVLVMARVVQGIGAAFLLPCSLALLTHECGDDAALRQRAIGLWTAAASVALALGPVLGGLLVDSLGWRSIFLLNLPICVVGIVLTKRVVNETPATDRELDLGGQSLALPMLLCLTGAVIEAGRSGFGAPFVLAGFGAAATCMVGFLVVEARSPAPMLPLSLFRNPTFSAATLVGLSLNFTLYGAIFVLGLYLQQVRGYSPLAAGLAFLPFSVAVGAANVAAGRIGGHRAARLAMASGLLVGGFGFWLLRHLDTTSSYGSLLPGLVVLAAGIGVTVPLMTNALLSTVPRSRSGVAAGVLNAVRQTGGAIGVALFGALMASRSVGGLQSMCVISAALLASTALLALFGVRQPTQQ